MCDFFLMYFRDSYHTSFEAYSLNHFFKELCLIAPYLKTSLKNKAIFNLSNKAKRLINRLLAYLEDSGTSLQSLFETKIKGVIKKIKGNPCTILAID